MFVEKYYAWKSYFKSTLPASNFDNWTIDTVQYFEKDTKFFKIDVSQPPIAIYLSELIHSETQDLDIVEKHAHLGLCIYLPA